MKRFLTLLYIEFTISFLIGRKGTILEIIASVAVDQYHNHVMYDHCARFLKSNQVKFTRFVLLAIFFSFSV